MDAKLFPALEQTPRTLKLASGDVLMEVRVTGGVGLGLGRLGSLLRLMGTSCIIRNGPGALLHFDLVPKMALGSIL